MQWWQIVVALFDLYLFLSIAPWVALQIVQSALFGEAAWPDREAERADRLAQLCAGQQALWPATPRSGRYAELDARAHGLVTSLSAQLSFSLPHLQAALDYEVVNMSASDVAALRAWPALVEIAAIWRDLILVRDTLNRSERIANDLLACEQETTNLPNRARAALTEARAELRRLQAHIEGQIQLGTEGLGDLAIRLREAEASIEDALDDLAASSAEQLPALVVGIDRRVVDLVNLIRESDRTVTEIEQAHRQSRDTFKRLSSNSRSLAERWQGLRLRGAGDAQVTQEIQALADDLAALEAAAQHLNLESFAAILDQAPELDRRLQAQSLTMDEIDQLLTNSGQAISGDLQSLAQAQARCNALLDEMPHLDLDISLPLVHAASERFIAAEEARTQGSRETLGMALSLSQSATGDLEQAVIALEPVRDQALRLVELLDHLSKSSYGDAYERLQSAEQKLRVYESHWERGSDALSAQAIALLERSWQQMASTPAEVLQRRRFRQSQLAQVLAGLQSASDLLAEAEDRVEEIERTHQEIAHKAEQIGVALDELLEQVVPSLAQHRQEMLPEVEARLAAVAQQAQRIQEAMKGPRLIDIDQTLQVALPDLFQECEEIEKQHRQDLDRYAKLLADARSRLQRAWSRLQRAEPYLKPGPQEDPAKLEAEANAWAQQAEAASDLVTQDRLVHEASALGERIDQAYEEIIGGRRETETLTRQYHRTAAVVRSLRGAIDTLRQNGRWSHLIWQIEAPDEAWEKALTHERDSQEAPTLLQANEKLRLAINACEQAEQAYASIERRMSGALQRLNNEVRTVEAALARGQALAQQLREHGQTEELNDIETLCSRVAHAVKVATMSPDVEDALRHLQEARSFARRL